MMHVLGRLIVLFRHGVPPVKPRNNKRMGMAYIRPVQTVAAGIVFGRPFSAPLSVR
jgi:hypothetical protein